MNEEELGKELHSYDRDFVAWLFNSDRVEDIAEDIDQLELAEQAFIAGRNWD